MIDSPGESKKLLLTFTFQRGNTFMMSIGLCDVLFMIYFCSTNIFFSDIIHKKYISIHLLIALQRFLIMRLKFSLFDSVVVCKIANIITAYLFVLPWSIFLGNSTNSSLRHDALVQVRQSTHWLSFH